VRAVLPDEGRAQRADDAGEQRAGQQPEEDELAARPSLRRLISTSTPTWMPVRTP
jgi:hypothetical protein